MPESVSLLMVEFLRWVSSRPRTYDETMEAWRSNCPRHTVWEDARLEGLVEIGSDSTPDGAEVTLTLRGRAILESLARQ